MPREARRCPKCPEPRRTQFSGDGDGDVCEVHGWVQAVETLPAVEVVALLHAIREPIEDTYNDSSGWKDLRGVLKKIDSFLAASGARA